MHENINWNSSLSYFEWSSSGSIDVRGVSEYRELAYSLEMTIRCQTSQCNIHYTEKISATSWNSVYPFPTNYSLWDPTWIANLGIPVDKSRDIPCVDRITQFDHLLGWRLDTSLVESGSTERSTGSFWPLKSLKDQHRLCCVLYAKAEWIPFIWLNSLAEIYSPMFGLTMLNIIGSLPLGYQDV